MNRIYPDSTSESLVILDKSYLELLISLLEKDGINSKVLVKEEIQRIINDKEHYEVDLTEKFSTNLQKLRRSRKLKAKTLADILSLDIFEYLSLEDCESYPSPHQLKVLSVFFNISIDELIGVLPKELNS